MTRKRYAFSLLALDRNSLAESVSVVLGRDDEYNDINLFLLGKERSGFETVVVQAWH